MKFHTNCAVLLIVLLKFSIGEATPQSVVGVTPTEKSSISKENIAEAYRLFLYGRYLEGQENIDEAIQAYRQAAEIDLCLLYTSPSPRDGLLSRMPSSA